MELPLSVRLLSFCVLHTPCVASSIAAEGCPTRAPVVDDKTRRRLDQSLSLLLPRSSGSISRSKRVRAWEGQPPRGEGGAVGGGGEEDALMSASDIAAALGDAVRHVVKMFSADRPRLS